MTSHTYIAKWLPQYVLLNLDKAQTELPKIIFSA